MDKPVIAIIANGQPIYRDRMLQKLSDVHAIIAADGGANTCRMLGIVPDYIIGDMDSISPESRNAFSHSFFIEAKDQEFTDMQKAIDYAISLNPGKLKIFSVFGRRSDHSFSNLLILGEKEIPVPVEVYDEFGVLRLLPPGTNKVQGIPGQTVSFFSLCAVKNLTLTGFKYPVQNKSFDPYFMGTSNEFSRSECTVKFNVGPLFMYIVE